MAAKTAKRVTFVKVDEGTDYVDARFDIILDGEKVGQVTRNVESVETSASAMSTSRIADYRSATVWSAEGSHNGHTYRDFGMNYRNRMDAVIDFLRFRGMEYAEARIAVGKRAW